MAFLACLALSIAPGSGAYAAAGVRFEEGSFQSALDKARREKRPLMLEMHAVWCQPCVQLRQQVLSSAAVAQGLEDFVAVRVDGEKGEGPALMERFKMAGYPTVLFLSPEGEELERVTGFITAEKLLAVAREALGGGRSLSRREQRLAGEPLDGTLAAELAVAFAVRGDEERTRSYLAHLEALAPGGPLPAPLPFPPLASPPSPGLSQHVREAHQHQVLEVQLAVAKMLYLRALKRYDVAIAALSRILERVRSTPMEVDARYSLAVAYVRSQQGQKAIPLMEEQLHEKAPGQALLLYATLAAREKFEMPRVLTLLEKARQLEPKNAALWDASAELHASMGEAGKAAAAEREAQRLEPNEPFYASQRERFQRDAAVAGAPSQSPR